MGVPYLQGLVATAPGRGGIVYGYDVGVHIHHNVITNNGTVEANPGAVQRRQLDRRRRRPVDLHRHRQLCRELQLHLRQLQLG